MSEEWLDFIINCRHGQPHDYDIVIGAMANDQINFCTAAALACLEFIASSDNLDSVCDAFIASSKIPTGNFDNVSAARFAVPSHWDIGKVYKWKPTTLLSATK